MLSWFPTIKLFPQLIHNCNIATVMNHNTHIWCAGYPICNPGGGELRATGWELLFRTDSVMFLDSLTGATKQTKAGSTEESRQLHTWAKSKGFTKLPLGFSRHHLLDELWHVSSDCVEVTSGQLLLGVDTLFPLTTSIFLPHEGNRWAGPPLEPQSVSRLLS